MTDYAAEARAKRAERLEHKRVLDQATKDAVAELGISEGRRYTLRLRWTIRRRRVAVVETRTERGLRFSGRVEFGLAEFYVPRPFPHGSEVSRFIEPADILEIVADEPIATFVGPKEVQP